MIVGQGDRDGQMDRELMKIKNQCLTNHTEPGGKDLGWIGTKVNPAPVVPLVSLPHVLHPQPGAPSVEGGTASQQLHALPVGRGAMSHVVAASGETQMIR